MPKKFVDVLEDKREEAGLSRRKLSLMAGRNATLVRDIAEGKTKRTTVATLMRLAEALNCEVDDLVPDVEELSQFFVNDDDYKDNISAMIHGDPNLSGLLVKARAVAEGLVKEYSPEPIGTLENELRGNVMIPEVDVRGGAGGGGIAQEVNSHDGLNIIQADDVVERWGMPPTYVGSVLGVSPSGARVVEVLGDSMEPTLRSGDRVMIDTNDKSPSPGGVFALWDGVGLVIKRVELIPNSDPATIKIKSDNPNHDSYERTSDEVNIVGRVAWRATKL